MKKNFLLGLMICLVVFVSCDSSENENASSLITSKLTFTYEGVTYSTDYYVNDDSLYIWSNPDVGNLFEKVKAKSNICTLIKNDSIFFYDNIDSVLPDCRNYLNQRYENDSLLTRAYTDQVPGFLFSGSFYTNAYYLGKNLGIYLDIEGDGTDLSTYTTSYDISNDASIKATFDKTISSFILLFSYGNKWTEKLDYNIYLIFYDGASLSGETLVYEGTVGTLSSVSSNNLKLISWNDRIRGYSLVISQY